MADEEDVENRVDSAVQLDTSLTETYELAYNNVNEEVPENVIAVSNSTPKERIVLQSIENQAECSPCEVQISTGLLNFLKKHSDGKAILKAYNSLEEKRPLSKQLRSRLVRLVIGREKTYMLKDISEDEALQTFVIKKSRFELLSREIVSIFKSENSATYFTPFVQEGDKCILASGKLWHNYNYVKKCLREDLLLLPKNVSKQPQILNDNRVALLNSNEDIVWLNKHLKPWDELVQKWTSSYITRRTLLTETSLSVYDYINRFPCLQTQAAKELFRIDCNLLYPNKLFVEPNRWIFIKQYLVSNLNSSSIGCREDAILAELLKTGELNSEKEDFITLYLLCHIIKPKRSGKRKRSQVNEPVHKLSLQERRESFILRVETANDVQPALLDLKQRYMERRETFQPVIVAVGPVLRIENYYVVVNEKLFNVDSILGAIEVAFHIFFALDCNYPKNTKVIWVFLQQILFNIKTNTDELTIDATVLVGHINSV